MNKSLVKRINDTSRLAGDFTLRSGKTSNIYFDKYQFQSNPQLLKEIVIEMQKYIPNDTEVLAGLEMGGIPLVTLLGQELDVPIAFIRKQAKTYGTCKYAEGTDLSGKKVVLIEDVVSSGGALLDAISKLHNDGITIQNAICVIDRQTGGAEALIEKGVILDSVITQSELDSCNE